MIINIDIKQLIVSLKAGEATPEQQREMACFLVLMKELGNWEKAEEVYQALLVSGMIDLNTQKV